MSDNESTGRTKKAVGKVQEGAGKAIGDKEMEARGKAKQAEGSVQKGVGKAQNAVKSDQSRKK